MKARPINVLFIVISILVYSSIDALNLQTLIFIRTALHILIYFP